MDMNRLQDAPLPPQCSRIPLRDKCMPTELRKQEDYESMKYAAWIGNVDITHLRTFLLNLPETHWQEPYNRQHNVYFQRPFHDKLGVNNIMCIFSDNQLENVYKLPFLSIYEPYLESIFKTMDISINQVVRCLFARMPGNIVIPPHHDNGLWVSKTHRVHVPIVTFPEVEFKSGPTVDKMTRYAFNEGTIIELNNAAKHSVENKSDNYRIHLIFDYLETSEIMPQIHTLQSGQLCRQIRGRVELVDEIDKNDEMDRLKHSSALQKALRKRVTTLLGARASQEFTTSCRHYFIGQSDVSTFWKTVNLAWKDQSPEVAIQLWKSTIDMFVAYDPASRSELEEVATKARDPPHWIIIGAQKCGTTSLFTYLNQHPCMLKGERREPHFFDWSWENAQNFILSSKVKNTHESIFDCYNTSPNLFDHNETSNSDSIYDRDMKIKYLCSLKCQNILELKPPYQIGESTPSYMLYGEPIAHRVKSLYPDVKLIIMVRDPVKRAFSHYKMMMDMNATPQQLEKRKFLLGKSFEDVVKEDIKLLENAGLCNLSFNPAEGQVPAPEDLDKFQEYANKLPMHHGAHAFIGRGLYVYQIALWLRVFPRSQILVLDLDNFNSIDTIQSETSRVFEFLSLPPHKILNVERQNTRTYDVLDEKMRDMLTKFYEPYNLQLQHLVGMEFKWCK